MSEQSGWSYLIAELKDRAVGPTKHVAFWGFFILGALGFGGFGIWFEIWRLFAGQTGGSANGVHTAMFTYFTALAGSSALHLILVDAEKPLRVFAMFCAAVFVVLAVWQSMMKPTDAFWAFGGVTLGSLLAVAMWWLTSGQDDALKDNIKPDSAVGGDTSKQPHGDLGGFKS
ncbi:hypothetical protein [Mesorhizobium amorphae]|uniref:Transmembrane protein n=1 Tax=Mesorhizobium amorphae CCNWGS0123 TaxID=1082933 RepID=G6YG77_9HYPH|nr:hypothetical protein [Mesorhizobium amorphae]ANT54809.1 hypothetical protein A6B35_33105 [Mesorhizobium amorphae CCNWGS0123]EHH09258.1 hypothetical protein MEA186_24927 [Mesorhizobium amorphae CCNWGS0123]